MEGWKDKDGDVCAKILEWGTCSEAAKYAVNGVDANAACCGCKKGWTFTRDCTETWGPQLAYSLGAEVVVEAIGGTGVTDTAYSNILPVINRVLPFDPKYTWDYTKWTPDAIVILIGPNDNEKSRKFKRGYLALLNNMAEKYSYATVKPKLINVCGGSGNGLDPCDEIQSVIATFNADRSDGFKAFFTRLTQKRWNKINDNGKKHTGADDHYTRHGVAVLIKDILPDVKKFMGWTGPAPTRPSGEKADKSANEDGSNSAEEKYDMVMGASPKADSFLQVVGGSSAFVLGISFAGLLAYKLAARGMRRPGLVQEDSEAMKTLE